MLPLVCCCGVLHLCASLTIGSQRPAGFNRVRMLTPDAGMIICALTGSRLVELSADGMLLRPHSNWRQWVMPEAQRDNAAHIALAAAAAAASEAATDWCQGVLQALSELLAGGALGEADGQYSQNDRSEGSSGIACSWSLLGLQPGHPSPPGNHMCRACRPEGWRQPA